MAQGQTWQLLCILICSQCKAKEWGAMMNFQTLVKRQIALMILSKVNDSYSIVWANTLNFQVVLENDN